MKGPRGPDAIKLISANGNHAFWVTNIEQEALKLYAELMVCFGLAAKVRSNERYGFQSIQSYYRIIPSSRSLL
jgi:hypothetical protein